MGVGDSPAPGNKRPTATRLTSFTSCPLQNEPSAARARGSQEPAPEAACLDWAVCRLHIVAMTMPYWAYL